MGSILLIIGIFLLALAIAGAGGMKILNRTQENAREEMKNEILQKQQELKPELVAHIFVLEKQLKNMRTLLSSHLIGTNVFRLIESRTHPRVRFTSFSFGSDTRKVDMSGEAASYTTIAQQVGILEREPEIERVEFGGLSSGEGGRALFRLSLVFRSSLLARQ